MEIPSAFYISFYNFIVLLCELSIMVFYRILSHLLYNSWCYIVEKTAPQFFVIPALNLNPIPCRFKILIFSSLLRYFRKREIKTSRLRPK